MQKPIDTEKREFWLASFIIFVLALITFYPSFYGDFISDDWALIVENPYLRSADYIPRFFTKGIWANSSINFQGKPLFRPLFTLWNFFTYSLFGSNPFGYHVILLLVHFFNTLLVLKLVRLLYPQVAFLYLLLSGAIFAVHPVQSQCIAWIAAGTDVILTFLFLTAFVCYIYYHKSEKKYFLVASLLFFYLSMLTKETGVVFFVLIIVYDFLNRKVSERRPYIVYAFFLSLLALYLFYRSTVATQASIQFSIETLVRFIEYILLCCRYILIPIKLPFYFRYPQEGIGTFGEIAIGVIGLALVGVSFYRVSKTRFPIIFGTATLLPTVCIAFYQFGVLAVRFLYLPMVGISLAIAAWNPAVRSNKSVVKVVGILLIVFFSVSNRAEIADWRDAEVFSRKVISLNPYAIEGYLGLFEYYQRHDNTNASISTLKRGISSIRSEKEKTSFIEKLGQLYAELGHYNESISTYELLISSSFKGTAYIGIGNNYWIMKQHQKALDAYRKAIEVEPENFLALFNYANINGELGNYEKAKTYYSKIFLLPPDSHYPEAIRKANEFLLKYK